MVWLVSNNPVLGFHLYITLSMLWLFPGADRQMDVYHERKEYVVCMRKKTQRQVQLQKYLPAGFKAACCPRTSQRDSTASIPATFPHRGIVSASWAGQALPAVPWVVGLVPDESLKLLKSLAAVILHTQARTSERGPQLEWCCTDVSSALLC